jgi:hypothetical protein
VNKHRLFPLGLECAHCERWHCLVDAIEHAEEFHSECPSCMNETQLSRALLSEATVAVIEVRRRATGRRQAVRRAHA